MGLMLSTLVAYKQLFELEQAGTSVRAVSRGRCVRTCGCPKSKGVAAVMGCHETERVNI